ncbi:MAG: IS110 family transposase [Pyrinomonadaceae bacterium]|jgi:transposase|nr:IS110 family transposase [Pyrinomonadaceae bacterium]MBA3570522.1 IS110 family transposase [Pyrinomonadaceae bacterium]
MTRRKQQKKFKVTDLPEHLQQVNLNAAGIDVGSDRHVVAVPAGRDEVSVREFGAFTTDLQALADWLTKCGITTVAMESTGVYWIPLFEILEQRGFEVKLVDARQVKNVSGRKSDVLDCQWLQQLHTYGLLAGAFRPADQICVLRGYMRQREMLVQASSMHIQHMQKALQQMNLLLHNVVSDITGDTGMKIIKAIIAGERNAKVLAKHRNYRCQSSVATIAKSLVGNYREEHLFALTQAVSLYETYQAKIAECEAVIARYLNSQAKHTDEEPPPGDKPSRDRDRLRGGVDVRSQLYRMTGVDLFNLPGFGADTLLTLAGEVGFDMTPWRSEKHFTSWLALCPGTKKSNGKVLSRKTKRSANRAAAALRIAAASLSRSKTALGAFYRRIRVRVGPAEAVTATARKLAVLYYSLLKYGSAYVETGQAAYEHKYQERRLHSIQKQALALGYQLIPTSSSF